jgi:hypothetical protein
VQFVHLLLRRDLVAALPDALVFIKPFLITTYRPRVV